MIRFLNIPAIYDFQNSPFQLNIEAEDGGTPKQSSETLVLIDVEPEEIAGGTSSTFDALSSSHKLKFSQRNYS